MGKERDRGRSERCIALSRLPGDDDDVFTIFYIEVVRYSHRTVSRISLQYDRTGEVGLHATALSGQCRLDGPTRRRKHVRRCHGLKEKPEDVWTREVKIVYERVS